MNLMKTTHDHPTSSTGTAGSITLRLLGRLPIVAVAAALVVSCPLLAAEDPAPLRLASDQWPPYTDAASNRRLAVDLVHGALDRAGVQATTSIVEFGAVMAGLRDGDFDGSAALWHSAERESFLIYSEPYLENRLVLVGRTGSDVSAASLSELDGRRVALVGHYAYGQAVDEASGPVFVAGVSDQQNLTRLLDGEVDYMLVDDLLIRYVIDHQSEDASRHLAVGTKPLVRKTLHFALRRDLPAAQTIIDRFNSGIRVMLGDGTYNDVLQMDWIRADVDGDGRPELVTNTTKAGEQAPTSAYPVLLPTSAVGQPSTAPQQLSINGKVFPDWNAVPDEYKVSKDSAQAAPSRRHALVEFKF